MPPPPLREKGVGLVHWQAEEEGGGKGSKVNVSNWRKNHDMFEALLCVVEQTRSESKAFELAMHWCRTMPNKKLWAKYNRLLLEQHWRQQADKRAKAMKVQQDLPTLLRGLSKYTPKEYQLLHDSLGCKRHQVILRRLARGG